MILVLALLLASCTSAPSGPGSGAALDAAVDAVAGGLSRGDLAGAPVDDAGRAASDLEMVLRGMDGLRPAVSAGDRRTVGTATLVTLHLVWKLAGGDWAYDTTATFNRTDGAWLLQWQPQVLHPELTSLTRLVHTRTPAPRGKIIGADHAVLAEAMPVVRLGIDKSRMSASDAATNAARLAAVLKIDAAAYVARVKAAGEKAFVEALVLRGRGEDIPAGFYGVPGALVVRDELVLSTRKGRAEALIGSVGEADAKRAADSGGAVLAGDPVGVSGLQLRHDATLRGAPGATITLVARPGVNPTPGPSPSAGSAPGSASPSPGVSVEPKVLFTAAPVAGADLELSLDLTLQDRAEAVIAGTASATAMAVVRPSTGAVLALATNAAAQGQELANQGRIAPGSTFKVVTALALLRTGLTPESPLDCTQFVTVDGRRFKNYNDFPANRVGRLSLTDALATSCNTAFISQHDRLSGARLRDAAASLGLGVDHEAGFGVFYGSIPDPTGQVGLAAAEIGQGTVEASPLAMAGVAASVAAGRTVVPWLLPTTRPVQTGTPLSPTEASQLQQMMRAVVTSGTGQSLRGVAVGAKSGTAEYGTATHAWMIAYTGDDLAIAVMVGDGASGAHDAAPLVKKLLS